MKRIVFLGDQVCADFFPVLSETLKPDVEVWRPAEPIGTTVMLLEGIRDWVLKRQPDVVVLASGILDTRKLCWGVDERLIPLDTFARNIRCSLKVVLERSAALPVVATISPVDRRRIDANTEFGYDNETISLYNEEAKEVARSLGVSVIDIYGIVKAASRADSWRPDGIRFDERSSDYLANQVGMKLRGICESLESGE